ncbi:MAG TPA: hypothetical protein VFW96_24365 [Thermomicrobiales bacterium]|nr:hypothetical protein [Thermomicrobiales bacterium]
MFLRGSGDRWHWSVDPAFNVNFCVWALRVDGLRVPPFDRHPDGDGALRALGLTPAGWRAWLDRVLERDLRHHEAIQHGAWPPPRDLAVSVFEPFTAWAGEPAVGAWLAEAWPRYYREADAWRRRVTGFDDPATNPAHLRPAEGRRLWRELKPWRKNLPPLRFYLVDYPEVVLLVLPPATALLGTGDGRLDQAGYAAAVLRTARALASDERPPQAKSWG